jgi:site-specific DNA-methyltransferase (adenine-specific)
MKFDVIVGNPPYHLRDGGQKASAIPLYNKFVQQAIKLNPRYLTMIIPARWYSGGRGLEKFRTDMLNDQRIRKLIDFTDSNDCFPGVDIAGGICYFLWDRDYIGECEISNILNGQQYTSIRKLNYNNILIRYGNAISIIDKIFNKANCFFDTRVSSQKPFGLRTNIKPIDNGDITLRYNAGKGNFKRSLVPSKIEWIDKWKVIISYLTFEHAGRPNKDGKRKIFSSMEILPPQTVCSETYIIIDTFDNKTEAENLCSYLSTKLVRFLVAQTTSTQHLSKSNFVFVPIPDLCQHWTDDKLYAEYAITKDEIEIIESLIQPMEFKGAIND